MGIASIATTLALNDCLVKAVQHVNERGERGLEEACRRWLAEKAVDLKARMKHMQFTEEEAGG